MISRGFLQSRQATSFPVHDCYTPASLFDATHPRMRMASLNTPTIRKADPTKQTRAFGPNPAEGWLLYSQDTQSYSRHCVCSVRTAYNAPSVPVLGSTVTSVRYCHCLKTATPCSLVDGNPSSEFPAICSSVLQTARGQNWSPCEEARWLLLDESRRAVMRDARSFPALPVNRGTELGQAKCSV
jgi:hypothetical protein